MNVMESVIQEIEKSAKKKKRKLVFAMWGGIVAIVAAVLLLVNINLDNAPCAVIGAIFGVTITAKISAENRLRVDAWQQKEIQKAIATGQMFGFSVNS